MRKPLRTAAAVLMLSCMGGNVLAATAAGCARPEDMTAIKAAAVQQRLMVAALSCDAAQLYNRFVTSYQRELQASDRALQNFFRRLNGKTGTEDYHAFKTRLANASSMQSIGNITVYCDSAKQVFSAALDSVKTSLSAFVAGQATSADDTYAPCQGRVRVGEVAEDDGDAAPPPQDAPVPHFKPGTIILWAQDTGPATLRN
jgi:hypothetical protein